MYTKRVRKLVGKLKGHLHKEGYLLPVVIGLGMGISIVSVTALQVISQNSMTLNTQYYNQLAQEAAQAGLSAAVNCIGSDQMDWGTEGNPELQPQTDCHGDTVADKPSSVLDEDSLETTYTVKALEQPYDESSLVVTSVGSVTVKDTGGNALTTFSKTVRALGRLNTSGGNAVTDISSGTEHTCAVAGGQAFCWGAQGILLGLNGGQLGNGTTTGSPGSVPVSTSGVLGGKTVTDISAGTNHTCAVASGQAFCWGGGGSFSTAGQLGNGSTTATDTPVAVSTSGVLNGKTVTAISAGNNFTCAVASGQAFCWGGGGGFGTTGQLGNGTTSSSTSPVAVRTSGVLNGKTVTDISAGKDHACAVADGKAYCWGGASFLGTGALGNGSNGNSTSPVAVSTSGVLNGKTVTDISAGSGFTCAVADGKAYCWGANTITFSGGGMLGNGSTSNSNVPVAVSTSGVLSGKTVTDISAGDTHACAVADGKAYCWGLNSSLLTGGGQLGNGTTTASTVPVAVNTAGVLGTTTVESISAGGLHSCAVASGGSYCWGSDTAYQLGNGPVDSSSTVPVNSNIPGVLTGKTVSDISTAHLHGCTIASNKAYCWGSNWYGQIGTGTGGAFTGAISTPTAVTTSGALGDKSVSDLDTGDTHTCAVADSKAYCWGQGTAGRLGHGSNNSSYVPVAVSTAGVMSGKSVSSISLGAGHSCAVASSLAYCWGSGTSGQLGNGSSSSSNVPVAVSTAGVMNGKSVSAVDAGGSHSCAAASGQAYCWGMGTSGQLGNGSHTSSNVPVAVNTSGVLSGKNVTSVSAGTSTACAVASGKAYCWGDNSWGQLGNGSNTSSNVPVAVSTSGVLSGKTVTNISAGYQQTCAVADGKVYCWGINWSGLGDGLTVSTNVPIAVKDSGVLNGKVASSVSVGQAQACAVADAKAFCWGNNLWGQLGATLGTGFYGGWGGGGSNVPVDVGGSNTNIGSPFAVTFDNLISF